MQRKVEIAVIVGLHTCACVFIYRLNLEPVWVKWLLLAVVWIGTSINVADTRPLLPDGWLARLRDRGDG